jgi:hypothetical protein
MVSSLHSICANNTGETHFDQVESLGAQILNSSLVVILPTVLSAYQYCSVLCFVVDQWLGCGSPVGSHRVAIQGKDSKARVLDTTMGLQRHCLKAALRHPSVRMPPGIFDHFVVCASLGDSGDCDIFAHSAENWLENPLLEARR